MGNCCSGSGGYSVAAAEERRRSQLGEWHLTTGAVEAKAAATATATTTSVRCMSNSAAKHERGTRSLIFLHSDLTTRL